MGEPDDESRRAARPTHEGAQRTVTVARALPSAQWSTAALLAIWMASCATPPAADVAPVSVPAASAPEAPPQPSGSDESLRALALIRRADETTYRPTDHGLRSIRCRVDVVQRSPFKKGPASASFTYERDDQGVSRCVEIAGSRVDPDGEIGRMPEDAHKAVVDDLVDGPRTEQRVAGWTLAMREEDGKPFVLAKREIADDGRATHTEYIDLWFRKDGPLIQDGPGDVTVHPFCSARRTIAYRKEGDRFLRTGGLWFDDSRGAEQFRYETVGGVLLPVKFTSTQRWLVTTYTLSELEVNGTR